MPVRETFHKSERLCSKSLIENLYEQGAQFYFAPFRVRWMIVPDNPRTPARIMISVPKSCFRKASDRNLLKRRIREAYRKEKHTLYESLGKTGLTIIFSITYQGKEILPYLSLHGKIILLLSRLSNELEKASE